MRPAERYLLGSAREALQQGRKEDARLLLTNGVRVFADAPLTMRLLGTLLASVDALNEAVEAFSLADMENCTDPAACAAHTRALWIVTQYDPGDVAVLEAGARLLHLAPTDGAARRLVAMALLSKRRFAETGDLLAEEAAPWAEPIRRLAGLLATGREAVDLTFAGLPFHMPLSVRTTQAMAAGLAFVMGHLCEEEELQMLHAWAGPVRTVAEVGCLVGNHSAFFLRALRPDRLITFEADPDMADLLAWTVAHNNPADSAVEIHRGFVSAEDGTCRFEGREVAAIRLDSRLRDPVDLIKIDVDGMELALLSAAEAVIATRPKIMLEVCEATEVSCRAWLEQRGYRIVARLSHGDYANLLAEVS